MCSSATRKSSSQKSFDDWVKMPGKSVKIKDGRTLDGVFDIWVVRQCGASGPVAT